MRNFVGHLDAYFNSLNSYEFNFSGGISLSKPYYKKKKKQLPDPIKQ